VPPAAAVSSTAQSAMRTQSLDIAFSITESLKNP
jgi:hypothetical protein